jgi:hypothetical protein
MLVSPADVDSRAHTARGQTFLPGAAGAPSLPDRGGRKVLLRFATERRYSWVEGYLEWLEGKEARTEYHARPEEELASLRG